MARPAQYVTEAEVMAVQAPEFTRSWRPLPHSDIITVMDREVKALGLEVIDKHYSMTINGANAFASWVVDQGGPRGNWMLGWRNSLQKDFAAAFCAGSHITVCSNMCFSGEYTEFRKHTSGLNLDTLLDLVRRALASFITKCREWDAWHDRLNVIDLPPSHYKILTYNAMERGILPPSKFNEFAQAHTEEVKLLGPVVGAYHGAHTRVQRSESLIQTQSKAVALNGLVNEYLAAINL